MSAQPSPDEEPGALLATQHVGARLRVISDAGQSDAGEERRGLSETAQQDVGGWLTEMWGVELQRPRARRFWRNR